MARSDGNDRPREAVALSPEDRHYEDDPGDYPSKGLASSSKHQDNVSDASGMNCISIYGPRESNP